MTWAEVYEALGKQGGGKAKAQELTEKDMGDRAASGKMEEWIWQVFFIFFHPKALHICYNNNNIAKF